MPRCVHLSAGPFHSMAQRGEEGALYTWGSGTVSCAGSRRYGDAVKAKTRRGSWTSTLSTRARARAIRPAVSDNERAALHRDRATMAGLGHGICGDQTAARFSRGALAGRWP